MVPESLVRLAGWCATVSAVVSVFGIVFLLLFFGGVGGIFGTLNDIAVAIQYVLMLPIAITLHLLLRSQGPGFSLLALLVGLLGIVAVAVLQILLVTGVLPFSQQIGMVVVAFLVATAWFVMVGRLDRAGDIVPGGTVLHVLAGLYFGYPVWAYRLGRVLLSL